MTNDMALEISCRDAAELAASGEDVVFLDCREADEYAVCRIEGALFVPLSEIADRLEELLPLRDRRIVVYCHHGMRSYRLAVWLRSQGFQQTQSLAGGIDRWAVEVDPSIPRY
ncbi:MAG: rhodanese [Planctomycetota bacterium]|nr:MAG: rhodanese [Planctomycetota bacterium]